MAKVVNLVSSKWSFGSADFNCFSVLLCVCVRACVRACVRVKDPAYICRCMKPPSWKGRAATLSVFSRNTPDDRATRRPVPPLLAYCSSHFLLAAPSSQTPLSAPPVHRQDSCCHPIPLLRLFLCSDGLNQTSDGISWSIHHRHLLPLCQQIVCCNSNSPVCLLFEHVHLSFLSGPSVHHQLCILPVGGV